MSDESRNGILWGAGKSSRLAGFYRESPERRRQRLLDERWLKPEDALALRGGSSLSEEAADAMIENVIGRHSLPLAVALNFVINAEERVLPMAVEEPSIVAACSYAAKLVAQTGGFTVTADEPWLTAQVQLLEVPEVLAARERILSEQEALLALANASMPTMCERGGGAKALEVRVLEEGMLCVHLHVDCRDAMGANTVNALAEGLAIPLSRLSGGKIGLRILTNLADRRKVYVRASVAPQALASEAFPDGAEVRDAIIRAQRFAELDVYRATTHNKGVMNGVDAVLLACGNDWRAVEAGAHAYACRGGRYMPLTRWWASQAGNLEGELVLPLATSIVGGAVRNHEGVRLALKLAAVKSSVDLAMLAGAAGLASNLSALKALSTEGIQRGHMSLHARRVAAEAGAHGEWIDVVASQLATEKVYRPERAREILAAARAKSEVRG